MTGPEPPNQDSGGGRRRRPGRSPSTSWLPGRLRPQGPFLPSLARHSETAKIRREDLEKLGRDPRHRSLRKKRLVRRTFWAFVMRWRYFTTAIVALFLVANVIAGGLVVTRDAFNDPNKLPTQSAPTLQELNRSIALGEQYIKALYKPLQNGEAVQSEASGVPLRAYFLDEDKWVLLGEDSGPATAMLDVHDSATSDDYTVSFDSPTKRGALTVHVQINWAFSVSQYQVQITPTNIGERAELWLDATKLNTFNANTNPGPTIRTFDDSDQSRLRMLRFTTRHASQEAFLYWSTVGHDPDKAAALGKFLTDNDFKPGFDLRAPLYPYSKNSDLPDGMPGDHQAYPDCDHIATGGYPEAYAYRSKVCLYESAYVANGERDPFLQAWNALTIITKYKDPNHEDPEWGWWTEGDTPNEVSTTLRGQWNRTGWGVPKCTPFSCAELSGIRTSVFGALEAEIGYVYHDATAQKFADAAAKVITMAQVGTDGKIRVDNGIDYIRPAQVGAFLGAWTSNDLNFTQPSTPKLPVAVALALRGASSTPLEYQGLVASNSETSLDALGFLQLYRCQKYKVNCN